MTMDFLSMKALGARTVITFEFCDTGADSGYYDGERIFYRNVRGQREF